MDLTWTSLDQLWRSPAFPMWLTVAAAAVFAIVFLVVVLRADRSIANGVLAVMTLLAVAVVAVVMLRGTGGGEQPVRPQTAAAGVMALPALACVDDLAGDGVEAACEKILFGAPDHVAAAVSYAAARLDRLTALGDVATAGAALTPELQALRRAVERDRYGLTAHVLAARDGCTSAMCPAYRSLTDQRQIAANIENRVYDGLVARYAPAWSGAAAPLAEAATMPATSAAATGEPPSIPTGRPTTAEFPSAASIPPVSIMTPEPATGASAAPAATPRPAASNPPAARAKAAPKAAPKAAAAPAHSAPVAARRPAPSAGPVQLAPSGGDD